MGSRQRRRTVFESEGENRMIKSLIRALKANELITDYLIKETTTESYQTFYVMKQLETQRMVKTSEYHITVYRRHFVGNQEYLGSSTFAISRKLTKKELETKIEEAVFAASFIKNKPFDLVKSEKKRSWKSIAFEGDPFLTLDKVAKLFFSQGKGVATFNSFEVFLNKVTTHLVNSCGVDYQKTLESINVEAIPSYDGEFEQVELYRYFTYDTWDEALMIHDAKEALMDVEQRFNAKKVLVKSKVDVILRSEAIKEFLETLIDDYSYTSVYKGFTDKKLMDSIQTNLKGEALTIALKTSQKADAFDSDGVVYQPLKIIEKGILTHYYGNNQYAQYLGYEPTGNLPLIALPKGKTAYQTMVDPKKPYLEIISLSGIQVDAYSDYIGGEIRLAIYFDGRMHLPVSGISFSGSIQAALSDLSFSQEITSIHRYEGPAYLKLKQMDVTQ